MLAGSNTLLSFCRCQWVLQKPLALQKGWLVVLLWARESTMGIQSGVELQLQDAHSRNSFA